MSKTKKFAIRYWHMRTNIREEKRQKEKGHGTQKDIIQRYQNCGIDWALSQHMIVVYIKHNNLSAGTRTFKPDTHGAELVPELKIVFNYIFTKPKGNALTSKEFSDFIKDAGIEEFYITGADATACEKSTCYNMTKSGYRVHVLSDCVTSYDKRKIEEMLTYYAAKGCTVEKLCEVI